MTKDEVIAGALFDFMGWLTSRKKRIVLSSVDEASPAVDAIKDFAKMRGLSLDNAQVQTWQEALAQPEQDYDALSQKHLTSIKRDMRVSLEDAAVRATHKVMAEFETEPDRAVNRMAQLELNAAIVQTLLPKLYSIIDRLLDGQDKALVIEARRVLPKAYKNSFEKGKGV